MGNVYHYTDEHCGSGDTREVESEVFFRSLGYTQLSAGKSDVKELDSFFKGSCLKYGSGLWWKWDRSVYEEDYPHCYQWALDELIKIRRGAMTDVYYRGEVKVVRTVSIACRALPLF